jgi:hypothetical protein
MTPINIILWFVCAYLTMGAFLFKVWLSADPLWSKAIRDQNHTHVSDEALNLLICLLLWPWITFVMFWDSFYKKALVAECKDLPARSEKKARRLEKAMQEARDTPTYDQMVALYRDQNLKTLSKMKQLREMTKQVDLYKDTKDSLDRIIEELEKRV